MRPLCGRRWRRAQQQNPELADLKLHITMVGFPTMGNNMDPFKTQDRSVNVAWTKEVNRLADLKLIDRGSGAFLSVWEQRRQYAFLDDPQPAQHFVVALWSALMKG